jgi:hypothetical protein
MPVVAHEGTSQGRQQVAEGDAHRVGGGRSTDDGRRDRLRAFLVLAAPGVRMERGCGICTSGTAEFALSAESDKYATLISLLVSEG